MFPNMEIVYFLQKGCLALKKPYWLILLIEQNREKCESSHLYDFAFHSDIIVIFKELLFHKLNYVLPSCCNKYLMNKLTLLL